MAISTYEELQAAIASWMDRSDITASIPDIIAMGEAMLNRRLVSREADAILTATIGSREINISSLRPTSVISLFFGGGVTEYKLPKVADSELQYTASWGTPTKWALDGEKINFDCPSDAEYGFRLRYASPFSLSDANPTNWLLTYYPDVYLAACIAWGGIFVADDRTTARYAAIAEQGIDSINNATARNRRGRLRVDPAMVSRRGSGFSNGSPSSNEVAYGDDVVFYEE